MTQLFYTPLVYNPDPAAARTSVTFDYTYFLYCTQMLGVISNLAALFTRGVVGDSIMRAASEVALLANAITVKLLSKAESIRLASATG